MSGGAHLADDPQDIGLQLLGPVCAHLQGEGARWWLAAGARTWSGQDVHVRGRGGAAQWAHVSPDAPPGSACLLRFRA